MTPENVIALNIGNSHLGIAVFAPEEDGTLSLQAYELIPAYIDPNDENVPGFISRSLIDFAEKQGMGLIDLPVLVAMPSTWVNTTSTPFPIPDSLDDAVLIESIESEAQEHLPYHLEYAAVDYVFLEVEGSDEAVELVLASTPLAFSERIEAGLAETKTKLIGIDFSSAALFNTYWYTFGLEDSASLIIDFGAASTDLVFIDGSRFYPRTIPVGGFSLTEAISEGYQMELTDAEEHKVLQATVEPEAGEDDGLPRLFKDHLDALCEQIMEEVNNFSLELNGTAPSQIFICGGGAALPGICEHMNQRLGLPVDFLHPLENVAIATDLNTDELQAQMHQLGVLTGLGVRGFLESPLQLDLRPRESAIAESAQKGGFFKSIFSKS